MTQDNPTTGTSPGVSSGPAPGNAPDNRTREISTPIMAALFVAIGALVIWDTTTYTDADSYVFPRTIASVMIGLSVLLAIQWLLGWTKGDDVETSTIAKSIPRRIGLVLAMIGAALLMPLLGFLISGILAFTAIMFAAMYDPWTPYRAIVYPIAGATIVVGFYLLFSRVLQVPLPEGTLPF
ncbi:MAG: tripartite tricarboxylate transporter TctB family protein [Alphaproteobacteria bacterium]|nr:tripartite tricarboxylate transporter TctB family protein [Alphaproteobacteria bacterium]